MAIEQTVLLGTVLEWQTCAISQRYEEMCQKLKRGNNKVIYSIIRFYIINCIYFRYSRKY